MAEFNQNVAPQRAARRRRGCAVNLFNVLTAMTLVVTILIFAIFLLFYLAPGLVPGNLDFLFGATSLGPTPTRVALAVVPTLTPSHTPAQFLAPTWTPAAPQATEPPPPTNTRSPTLTPSITPTFPPPTPTRTPSPTPTETPTPGPSPTVTNTRSPFPFTKSDTSPMYLQNFANAAGCNWLGVAGEVLDLNGNPVPSGRYQVRVWESGIDSRVQVGGAPAYGPSGWEQFVFDAPAVRDYSIQLETTNGTAVSQVYRVQTRASCNQNLLLFNFVQNH